MSDRLDNLKDISTYGGILLEAPFRINRHPKQPKDLTVWCKVKRGEHFGLQIYFHGWNIWCNPPTDSTRENRAETAIERYGIEYLAEGEEL